MVKMTLTVVKMVLTVILAGCVEVVLPVYGLDRRAVIIVIIIIIISIVTIIRNILVHLCLIRTATSL